jgi:hypothetical protein
MGAIELLAEALLAKEIAEEDAVAELAAASSEGVAPPIGGGH